jgi:Cellulose binding domain
VLGAGVLAVRGAAIPRQRKAPVNMPVGALATGRPLGGSAASPPTADQGAAFAEPTASSPDRAAPGGVRAWLRRLGAAPAWARAVVIGAVAAGLAMLVLGALVYTPGSHLDESSGDPGTAPEAERGAPGVAVQPGDVASHTPPAEPPGPEGAGRASDPPGSPEAGATGGAGVEGSAPGGGAPEATGSPDPTAGAVPVLTAQLATSDRLLLGLGGVAVSVTVANPGPGSAASWEIAVDVGDQDVTNVLGADYVREGSQAIFTPVDAELAAGASIQFSFDLPGVLASGPTACTIDGNPCG